MIRGYIYKIYWVLAFRHLADTVVLYVDLYTLPK